MPMASTSKKSTVRWLVPQDQSRAMASCRAGSIWLMASPSVAAPLSSSPGQIRSGAFSAISRTARLYRVSLGSSG